MTQNHEWGTVGYMLMQEMFNYTTPICAFYSVLLGE